MAERKFKVGDRVRIVSGADKHKIGLIGTVSDVKVGRTYPYRVKHDGGHDDPVGELFREGNLEPAPRDLDHLHPGDILVDEFGIKCKVIDVLPNSVLLSEDNEENFDEVDNWFTISWIKDAGYALKDQPTDVTELSVADIEAKLDLPSGSLRVKKD